MWCGAFAYPTAGCGQLQLQFAILALWVAKRHGVDVDRPIALVEKHFRKTQLKKQSDTTGNNLDLGGSWPYAKGNGNSSRGRR